ncbi:MAG TPA: lipocalin family protein [Candidatus Eisenbacteria bacterium]|nr:lipocalin family protein [Candidatus Eisenbacteria bacterium]
MSWNFQSTSCARRRAGAVTSCLLQIALASAACSPAAGPTLQTVRSVDLSRYVGTWYEIASYPQRFQKGCTGTTATYTLRADGKIDVLNRCARDSLNGRVTVARGQAKVVDESTNAKLKVTFFWPFWGDYWIIDLGRDYEYAVVGHPSRKYLWILSRAPVMDATLYEGILVRLRGQGYDTTRLVRTLQRVMTG